MRVHYIRPDAIYVMVASLSRAATLQAVKLHEWHGLFEQRLVDINAGVYSEYERAVRQAHGFGGVFERLRGQLPRSQNQSEINKGIRSAPPNTVRDAYMHVGELAADIYDVLDTAISVHSPPTWRGPALLGRDIARKAAHVRVFVSHFVTEWFADTLPDTMLPAREEQRASVNERVLSAPIHADTRPLLLKLHKRLGKLQSCAKLQPFFLRPPSNFGQGIPLDYLAVIKSPIDLRTIGDKLAHQEYER